MHEEMRQFDQALAITLAAIAPLACEPAPLLELTGRVAGDDVVALVDAPSTDVSLKDGYAVRSADIAGASSANPVVLKLIGSAVAGGPFEGVLPPGTAVRVLSGAGIPHGADAVLAEECAGSAGGVLTALADAGPGRNILRKGTDVAAGQGIIARGTVLRPAQVGLLAAAGYARLDVVRRPRVGIIATGDEIVAPGGELRAGLVYASNLTTMAAWCGHFGMQTELAVVRDDRQAIEQQLIEALQRCDAIVTSGGAWRGERDLVAGVLDHLGWRKLYHHVKIGPGKAVGCGIWTGKPVFCLPGGPPSSQMAFLQLALPALLKLAGHRAPGLPWLTAELAEDVTGQSDWTQFIEGQVTATPQGMQFRPRKAASRLQSMADADGLIMIPEGIACIHRGTEVPVQLLPHVLPSGAPPGWPIRQAVADAAEWAARPPKPAVVSFVAMSGTGKTTFLEQLVPELTARGVRVGILKHHAHATSFDAPGKDTDRLAQAGAKVVVGVCSVQVAVFRQEDGSADLAGVIARDLAGTDLVLTEGFKRGPYPKIEVHRSDHNPELLCAGSELLALVTDEPRDVPVPQFALTDVAGVAAFLCAWLKAGRAAVQPGDAGEIPAPGRA
jgi:molybdopterin molybdotransferase